MMYLQCRLTVKGLCLLKLFHRRRVGRNNKRLVNQSFSQTNKIFIRVKNKVEVGLYYDGLQYEFYCQCSARSKISEKEMFLGLKYSSDTFSVKFEAFSNLASV